MLVYGEAMSKVSIITASYNYENFIKETIESVINQTFQDWELIIVDDGSKDNSVEVIKSYCQKDARIKLFQHENGENKGLAETIKLGIQKTQSEWIAFLESDDTITPDYLAEKFNIIDKYPKVDFIFNDVNMFGEQSVINWYDTEYFSIVRPIINGLKYPNDMFDVFRKFDSDYNMIPTFSIVMLRKNLLDEIDFNSPVKVWLDWHIWLQLVGKKKYQFFYINKKLTNWRMHNKSYINCSKEIEHKSFILFSVRKDIILKDFISLLKIIRICIIRFDFKNKKLILFDKECNIPFIFKIFSKEYDSNITRYKIFGITILKR